MTLKVRIEAKHSTGRYKIKVIDCLRGKKCFQSSKQLKEMILSSSSFSFLLLLVVDKC